MLQKCSKIFIHIKKKLLSFFDNAISIPQGQQHYNIKEIMGYPKKHRGRRKMGSKKRRARKKNKKK